MTALQARDIFERCLDAADHAAINRLLDHDCAGDPQLREAVLALLRMNESCEGFLERPAEKLLTGTNGYGEETRARLQVGMEVGSSILGYKLLQVIGEGGFGTVYMAQQTEPVRRKVALKVIKPGMDSKEVVARFEAERQALAMMDHPNVAKVLDGGTTDNGRPFFVMELVHGTPITKFCDETRMSNRDRLGLFVDVCRAVQHAHLKGIIHRDLKPSNILVTMDDDRPLPKVIDFGISKALGQSLIDKTMITAFGQMVGTPLYMSPEQAQLSANDVDVRSDVYSLGVLLYELLTGNTPFDRDELKVSGFDEMRRIIREVEPPRPSAQVSTLQAQALSTICDRRTIDERKLGQSLRGELDWIVMKALAKERTRRYQSAKEFADDIQRFLNDEPVVACPPSMRYRVGKFARRHRGMLTTLGLIAAASVTGLSVAVWQAFVIAQERDRAIAAETRAEREATISIAVNNFLNEDLLAQASPLNQPDPDVPLRAVLDSVAGKLEQQFAGQPLVEAEIRHTLATTYQSLGENAEAQKHADRSLALRNEHLGADCAETIESKRVTADILLAMGDYSASRKILEGLLTRARRALGIEDRITLKVMNTLAIVLMNQGKLDAAEKLNRETLDLRRRVFGDSDRATLATMSNLANVLLMQEQFAASEDLLKKALKTKRAVLGKEHQFTLTSLGSLARLYRQTGRYEEALGLHREVIEALTRTHGEDHPRTLTAKNQLAEDLHSLGRLSEAETLARDVLAMRRLKLAPSHPDIFESLLTVGNATRSAGRPTEAAELFREAWEGYRALRGDGNIDTLACMINLANTLQSLEQYENAEQLFEQAITLSSEGLGAAHTRTITAQRGLSNVYMCQGRIAEAESLLEKSIQVSRRELGDGHPLTLNCIDDLSAVYQEVRRFDDAARLLHEVVNISERVLGENHMDTLSSISNLATVYMGQGKVEAAIKLQRQAFERQRQELGAQHPKTLIKEMRLANFLSEQNRLEEAVPLYKETIAFREQEFGEGHPDTLLAKLNLALTLRRQKELKEAHALLVRIVSTCRGSLGDTHQLTLSSRYELGNVLYEQGELEESLQTLQAVLDGRRKILGNKHPDTIVAMKMVGLLQKNLKLYDQAEVTYKEFLELAPQFWDEGHPGILDVRDNLAIAFRESDRIDDWERTVRENLRIKYQVLGQEDSDTKYSRRQLAFVLVRRAEQLVLAENFDDALGVLSEIAELSPNHKQAESLVALQLYLKKQEATAVFSQQLWQLAQAETGDEFQKARWIVDALLSPHHGLDTNQVIEFTQALAAAKDGLFIKLALGLAHYRQGDCKQAAETIATSDQGTPWIRPLACYFSAMAHHRIGDTERAQELFDLAVERSNRMASTPTEGVELQSFEPTRWALWCIYQGVEREAAEVLESESSKQLAESGSEK